MSSSMPAAASSKAGKRAAWITKQDTEEKAKQKLQEAKKKTGEKRRAEIKSWGNDQSKWDAKYAQYWKTKAEYKVNAGQNKRAKKARNEAEQRQITLAARAAAEDETKWVALAQDEQELLRQNQRPGVTVPELPRPFRDALREIAGDETGVKSGKEFEFENGNPGFPSANWRAIMPGFGEVPDPPRPPINQVVGSVIPTDEPFDFNRHLFFQGDTDIFKLPNLDPLRKYLATGKGPDLYNREELLRPNSMYGSVKGYSARIQEGELKQGRKVFKDRLVRASNLPLPRGAPTAPKPRPPPTARGTISNPPKQRARPAPAKVPP